MTKEELLKQFSDRIIGVDIIPARTINKTHTSMIWNMAFTYVCSKIMDEYIITMTDAMDTFTKLVEPHIVEINLSDILKEDEI